MRKRKRILLPFLALNAILSSYSTGNTINSSTKYEGIFNKIIQNTVKGNSNKKNYQTIERILKLKNKELNDLYLQNDYIIKPEYLEWQVFLTGFYEEHGSGADNTSENAKYHSKVSGYYDLAGNYVVTSNEVNGTEGKPYLPLQKSKTIDLGIGLQMREPVKQPISLGINKPTLPRVNPLIPKSPVISAIIPQLPQLPTFTIPNVAAPPTLGGITITLPTPGTIIMSGFDPLTPNVIEPSTFSPPALNEVSTGFSQGNDLGFDKNNEIIGNADIFGSTVNQIEISVNDNQTIVAGGAFTFNASNDKFTSSGTVSSGTYNTAAGVSHQTFLNALAGSYSITGNWSFKNLTTTPVAYFSGTTKDTNTVRFVSVNHAYGSYDKKTVFELNGDVQIFGRENTSDKIAGGTYNGKPHITVGIEHQSYGALPAKAINNGMMILERDNAKENRDISGNIIPGTNLIGMTGMVENYKDDTNLGPTNTPQSARNYNLWESTMENRGTIMINSRESIGMDFAEFNYHTVGILWSFYNKASLNLYSVPGNIVVNGDSNYGLRVANIFNSLDTRGSYYDETVIDGSKGTIAVNGTHNVGVSIAKIISGSDKVLKYQQSEGVVFDNTGRPNYGTDPSNTDYAAPANGDDLIGNIYNLQILVNGEENIGFLRKSDYMSGSGYFGSTLARSRYDFELTDSHIRNINFTDEAINGILIRTDKYGINLKKNLDVDGIKDSVYNTIPLGMKPNNIVLLANETQTGTITTPTTVKNSAVINLGYGLNAEKQNALVGMAAANGGKVQNNAGGIINVNSKNSGGIAVLGKVNPSDIESEGSNLGNIIINGKNSTGVYNAGKFDLLGGTILSEAENSIGVYSTNTINTNISGGNITAQNGGIALYSGDNSVINLSGANITANQGGLLFYNYVDNSGLVTGKYDVISSSAANVNAGGMLLYAKLKNSADVDSAVNGIKTSFNNPGNLTVNMAAGSSIMFIDTIGNLSADITDFSTIPDIAGDPLFFNFIGTGYNQYVMNDFDLTLNNTVDSNLDTGVYGRVQFINSDITVTSGVDVTGTQANQVAVAQKNKIGNPLANRYIINNGNIILSGNQSTGLAGDYVTMTNASAGTIKLGTNSVGMYAANGSDTLNQGLIELGAGSVGIYGRNYFDGITSYTVLGYGNDKIDIENQKDIKTISGGVSGDAFGIYADNTLNLSDSKVNLTSTSNIDLEGTGTVIGTYLKKTDLANAGIIKVESTGNAVGIYGDESTASSITGNIEISGGASGSGIGIYLKNSNMSNGAALKVDNVNSGIGIYVEATAGNTSSGINANTISVGDKVTGMYALGASAGNTGTITNSGTIQSLAISADKAIGMYIGAHGVGMNAGNIKLTAAGTDKDQVGVYNHLGTFTMGSGNIEVYSQNGAGLYANAGTANILSGGTIKTGNGAIGLYADNGATIQLSGTYKSIVENGGVFALNNGTGNINVSGGNNIVVDVEAGGMAFSSTGSLNTYLSTLVTGGGTLEINLKDPTSKLAILDSPGTMLLSSLGTAYAPGTLITPQVKISSSSNPNYTPFSITKGHLVVDQQVNLNLSTDSYNKSDFINSSVDVNSAITGSNMGQLAVGQVNYASGLQSAITLNNNSIIDLSGDKSTGMLADYGNITNTGGSFIKVTGEESVGIYTANGTITDNTGTINIGNKSVGIYGVNYLDGVTSSSVLGYGDDKINITNNGSIISTGTTHGGYGIYSNNTIVPVTDSAITLGAASNIDVSSGEVGIGVYAVNSTLNIDGTITVGKNGVGVYASGSTGTINGGTINLIGDNAIGYYLTNSTNLTNAGGAIHVDGKNITLMITDAGSSINLSTPFAVTSTSGSTYVVGNMIGGDFYNGSSASLGSNGSLVNGVGTIALFGMGSNVNSTGSNVSGMVLSGQNALIPGHVVAGSGEAAVDEEGTNRGIITLGDSAAGIYLTDGARGRNEGTITVNNNSVGIYAEGTGSHIVNNNGTITVGQESTGLFLKDGVKLDNTGTSEIKSMSQKAVGIYSERTAVGTTVVTNNSEVELNGDQSIGIYTTGENSITNSGTILIGNSLSQTQPGIGIYADNANSHIDNTSSGTVTAGDNGVGIYNLNGNITNSGTITAGTGGTGIYSDGGIINLNAGSSITVGQNDAVGVYAVNQAGTVTNNSAISIGDGSYGFVFTGTTTPAFVNNHTAIIGNNSIFVFSDSVLAADNSNTLTMTGSDNIGYYLKNGGSFVNNGNITGNTGTANIGVYAKGANIVNNADIILGDSNLTEHTDINGKKYKTGYSVGIYGENSNVTNNTGRTVQVGKEGIGIYVSGSGYSAENHGIINGIGDNAKGIYAADHAMVRNYGTINMVGDNVMGIAGQNGAQIYNDYSGVINVTGNDVTGIYLAGDDTILVNHGQINITGTGLGITYTPTVNQNNVTDSTGATQGYTSKQYDLPDMPTLVNTGEININVGGNFNYDGIRVIVTIDPSTNTPTTNSSSQVGFGGVIPDKLEVAPDFAVGTASDRYIFENIFKGVTGKGDYISQSLTWDATAQGSDLVMTRRAYTEFTDGLWFEDFGIEMNEKYAVTYGEGRQIFDKINYITNESDFRHVMGSMAGSVYANINQREYDIAKTFENSLDILQNSENNTKENVKISVIGGKGKNKEETDGVIGYDYTTTGVLALREVERTYKHTFGYSLGYVHTGFEFKDGNESEELVDTVQLGIHNKYKSNNWLLRNDLTGRASIHNVDRNIDWPSPNSRSEMDGRYETYSITSDNVLGREFELGKKASIMPYGAFKAMYVTRLTFNESGLEALEVEGNDAWSVKPRAGIELKGMVPLGTNWQLKGTLDFAYEYELADLNEREKARLIAIEDGYHKLSKPQDEKGTFRTKAAVGVEVTDRYGIFLTGEYSTGNDKEDDYRTGLILKAVF